jgi:signal transduction histidine kinase
MSPLVAETVAHRTGAVSAGEEPARPDESLLDHTQLAAGLGSPELPIRRWPERRIIVLACATVVLIGAFAASMVSENALDELAVLYTVPAVLAGLELGVPGGVGVAAIALLLLLAASGSHSELGAPGLAASGTVFVIAGALAGRFSERMRAAQYRQGRLLNSGLRLARLEDIDALPTVLANELQQALDLTSVEVQLHGAPTVAAGGPAGKTLRVPISAHGIDFGCLTLGLPAGRSFSPEDRAVAAKLALQAGVAADNQRLLASERERAALHGELERARGRLADHLRNVSQILDSQEAERREIARQLHEQAAQAIAGVLFGLQVLERDLDQELTRKQLEEVCEVARDTLADVRQLAVNVRPPSLDDLGLQAALEGIAEREATRRGLPITLHCDHCPPGLATELETCAYHVVQDAIQALDGSLIVRVNVDHDRDKLRINVGGPRIDRDEQVLAKLATARARVDLIGGTLQTNSTGTDGTDIVAELPLDATPDTKEPR